MVIAIYGRAFQDNFIPHIQRLFNKLESSDIDLLIYETFYLYLESRIKISAKHELYSRKRDLKDKPIDYLISIGGDGTLLDTISAVKDSGIPILGINTGRLGFLSSISKDDVDQSIDAILNGNYKVDKRTLLSLETSGHLFGEGNFALNELTVHKKDSSSMITIHTYINDDYLNSYWADGLIVATPTGSTAYSLSCGGPIIVPGSENFVITPIAPHNLNVRPVVVHDSSIIRLQVEGREENYLASLDSRSAVIDSSTELIIKKASFEINLIQLENQNFLNTIRNKMMWGLDRRN